MSISRFVCVCSQCVSCIINFFHLSSCQTDSREFTIIANWAIAETINKQRFDELWGVCYIATPRNCLRVWFDCSCENSSKRSPIVCILDETPWILMSLCSEMKVIQMIMTPDLHLQASRVWKSAVQWTRWSIAVNQVNWSLERFTLMRFLWLIQSSRQESSQLLLASKTQKLSFLVSFAVQCVFRAVWKTALTTN